MAYARMRELQDLANRSRAHKPTAPRGRAPHDARRQEALTPRRGQSLHRAPPSSGGTAGAAHPPRRAPARRRSPPGPGCASPPRRTPERRAARPRPPRPAPPSASASGRSAGSPVRQTTSFRPFLERHARRPLQQVLREPERHPGHARRGRGHDQHPLRRVRPRRGTGGQIPRRPVPYVVHRHVEGRPACRRHPARATPAGPPASARPGRRCPSRRGSSAARPGETTRSTLSPAASSARSTAAAYGVPEAPDTPTIQGLRCVSPGFTL